MTAASDDEEIDTLVLAGVRSPGQVKLSGHDRTHAWDEKPGDGQDGASLTYKGKKLATFTATFDLVNDPTLGNDDLAAWDAFAKVIESTTSGTEITALDIYHPDLARNGIKAIVQGKVGGMQRGDDGRATVAVEFKEYAPPKKKSGSPQGSKAKSTTAGSGVTPDGAPFGPPAPDPNQAAKDELAALVAEANAP